jgi:hypothetical protein
MNSLDDQGLEFAGNFSHSGDISSIAYALPACMLVNIRFQTGFAMEIIMKRMVVVFACVLLLASAPMATDDLTGKWAGSFRMTLDGETRDDVAYMSLKQNGTEITGTAGPNSEQQ